MGKFFIVNPVSLLIWSVIAFGSCSTAWHWYGKVRDQNAESATVNKDFTP